MENFDYSKAIAELEEIAAKVEDPSTGLGDIDLQLRRATEIITACRAYLRTMRDKTDILQ